MKKNLVESGEPGDNTTRKGRARRWARLGLGLLLLGTLWLYLLPRIARLPAVNAHRQWLDQREINPSAMYYTDLKVMKSILSRQEEGTRRRE